MKRDGIEPVVGEVEAYRAFIVHGTELWSIGVGEHKWTPGPNRARCHVAGKKATARTVWVNDPNHPDGLVESREKLLLSHGRIPAISCTCGFWVFKDEWVCREEFEAPDLVIGKVRIWGRAVEHRQGYRTEYARLDALVSDDPERVGPLLDTYAIPAIHSRTKAEQGCTTAWITKISGRADGTVDVKLDWPTLEPTEEVGMFRMAAPDGLKLGAFVRIRFAWLGSERWITDLREETEP